MNRSFKTTLKARPTAPSRPRPYQGVRVKDPVKELLRRKRRLFDEASCSGDSLAAVCEGDGKSSQWTVSLPATSTTLQPAVQAWSPSDCQQDASTQHLSYTTTSTVTADVYMQTLCPGCTMLTYTHTPLLTNFGTIPVAPATCSLPHMELPESGFAYIPWSQPFTTLSTMPSSGVQFGPGSATLSGSSLVHMPLSTMFPQQDTQGINSQPQSLEPLQYSHQINPEPRNKASDEDGGAELEASNLLDKILESQRKDDELGGKEQLYSTSLFLPNAL
ncbi:POU domain class 2-associating factor 1 [Dunckerocampus dactyliophorus]|uniref:POU domain class 2-associating factor 1 n=1 Tax=Dunckerocampus dactyliophorus TaxID=161453 RepID=UPI00240725F9|nr:POU domain class 2-associating factor 1 [Dunckerocampus dactyliophorus]